MTNPAEVWRRTPLRPLQSVPPIVDTAIDPSGEVAVEVDELCERAGIRYRVSGGWPPLIAPLPIAGPMRRSLYALTFSHRGESLGRSMLFCAKNVARNCRAASTSLAGIISSSGSCAMLNLATS